MCALVKNWLVELNPASYEWN